MPDVTFPLAAHETPTPRLRFVVPAYNEARNLPHLLNSIRRFLAFFGEQGGVWIVDDGSTDATAEVVRSYAEEKQHPCPRAVEHGCLCEVPIRLVRHPVNRGPGAAFRTGFTAALEDAPDQDLIVTIEADNTSDLAILNRMLDRSRRGFDLVLASVYGEGRVVGAPWERKLLSQGANLLVKSAFGLWGLHTFSSFFRMHRVALLRRAQAIYGERLIEEPGFVCMVELLVKLHRIGASIAEVPMLLDSNIRQGDSKLKIARTTLSYLRVIARLRRDQGLTGRRDAAAPVPR